MLKVKNKEIKIILVILLWAVSGFWIAKEAPVESFRLISRLLPKKMVQVQEQLFADVLRNRYS